MPNENAARIAALNDAFRKSFVGGRVVATPSVMHSPYRKQIIEAVQRYEFQGIDGNNPYGENDFLSVIVNGNQFFGKIDYYDNNLEMHSPDPSDPKVTKRVLTIMHSSEY